ncbi:MAG: hypothetical protein CBD18_05755 [Opitutales bacterium TMED158]|nr:MAG: hypothetical protein CBD18_05755 [Opitutales bacterium TMED158]
MSFTDAIPVQSRSQGRPRFGEAGRYGLDSNAGNVGRQTVNISRETMDRVARAKLGGALSSKLAYNRSGSLGQVETIGQHLSTKA